ncbi:MAG: DJ-1/PfpI family protein [Flavobacteriaceae bacterium]
MKKIALFLILALTFNSIVANTTPKKKPSKVLLVLPNNTTLEDGEESGGFSLSAVIDLYGALTAKGIKIDIASPNGGELKLSDEDLSDVYNYGAVASYFKSQNLEQKLKKTIVLGTIIPSNYKAIVCIGGLASVREFSVNKTLKKIIKTVYENNGFVAALDNATSALINVQLSNKEFLLKGKKVTTFTQAEMLAGFQLENKEALLKLIPQIPEDTIKQNGGLLQEPEANQMFRSRVVEDERVITGGYQRTSAGQLANTVLKKITTPKKKILIVVTSNDKLLNNSPAGFYLPEVTDFHYILSNGGDFEFDIASPKGGKAPMYDEFGFLHDQAYQKYLLDTGLLIKLYNTIPLSEINAENYEAIHFAGGFASLTDFPSDENLKNITRDIYENDGIVSAVCHGPSALLNVKLSDGNYLLEGRKVTSRTVEEETANGAYTKEQILQNFPMILEDEIRKQGAIYTKSSDSSEGYIETDGRLVTGQGVPSTTPLAKEVLKQLSNIN